MSLHHMIKDLWLKIPIERKDYVLADNLNMSKI